MTCSTSYCLYDTNGSKQWMNEWKNKDWYFARNREETFEKLVAVQWHVNEHRKMKSHILSQIGNAKEIPMHFNTSPNIIDKIRDKFEVMKTSDRPTKRCKHLSWQRHLQMVASYHYTWSQITKLCLREIITCQPFVDNHIKEKAWGSQKTWDVGVGCIKGTLKDRSTSHN